jgi:hypothetical protein
MMKRKVVVEAKARFPFPIWIVHYKGHTENLGDQSYQLVRRIDQIYEEIKDNLEVDLKLLPLWNKPQLKGSLFLHKPYFGQIKLV